MTLFNRILGVHLQWLKDKGYNEPAFSSQEKPGLFSTRLKLNFFDSIRRSLDLEDIQDFTIALTGYFEPEKTPVHFTFYYRFNPENITLELSKMTSRMRQYEKTYTINRNTRHQLPTAANAYTMLSVMERQEMTRTIAFPDPKSNNTRKHL